MSVFSRLAARAERAASALAFEASVHVVASRRGIDPQDVRAGRRSEQQARTEDGRFLPPGDDAVRARQEALYLAHAVFNRPVRSVARAAGLSAPAVLKAVRAVEDRRDDHTIDRRLDELELELMPGGLR